MLYLLSSAHLGLHLGEGRELLLDDANLVVVLGLGSRTTPGVLGLPVAARRSLHRKF